MNCPDRGRESAPGSRAHPGPRIELSFVIPVFNGARTIGGVVRQIREFYADLSLEVVLVNDGSRDDSEQVCRALHEEFPDTVTFLHLARNFGEHNAVLAGLAHSRGEFIAILDDDGQNPPEEVRKMYDAARAKGYDVVYGRYQVKQHSRMRNLGSTFTDRIANVMLHKPPELYLSSFKVMNRFLADELARYTGAFPYIDGLILRSTSNIGQVIVEHRAAASPRSNYTMIKLVRLWGNMFLNFSILPLRLAGLIGLISTATGFLLLIGIVLDKLFISPDLPHGIPTVIATVVFFAGAQLMMLGAIGEYLGRLFLDHSRKPQFVVRYLQLANPDAHPEADSDRITAVSAASRDIPNA